MSRFIRNVLHMGKSLKVSIATDMKHRGYYRAANLIEPRLIDDSIDRLEVALKEKNVLAEEKAQEAEQVLMTSMDHTSPSDRNRHCTMMFLDAKGKCIATLHVTHDPDQQQPAR